MAEAYEEVGMILHILTMLCACLLTFGLTGWYIDWAQNSGRLDIPNERSSHEKAVPVGGGLVVVMVTLILWVCFAWPLDLTALALLGCTFLLGLISWIDDKHPLPWWLRLGAQLAAVFATLALLPQDEAILPFGLSPEIERVLIGLAWVWFINLFNFMDGMDGLAGGETVAVTVGILLVHAALHQDNNNTLLTVLLAGASLGFLAWNWHPAKLFMGDVGAVPLGFMLGWLLIDLMRQGAFAAALILPLYFLADASLTLLRRIWLRAKPWEAHKTHFYQRAHQGGYSHSAVVGRIMLANLILVALSQLSVAWPWATLVIAFLTVLGLLYILQKMADQKS